MTELERAASMAAAELDALRLRNAILEAKVEMFDQMMTVLHSRPPERGGISMGEDAVWLIRRELDRLRAEREKRVKSSASEGE